MRWGFICGSIDSIAQEGCAFHTPLGIHEAHFNPILTSKTVPTLTTHLHFFNLSPILHLLIFHIYSFSWLHIITHIKYLILIQFFSYSCYVLLLLIPLIITTTNFISSFLHHSLRKISQNISKICQSKQYVINYNVFKLRVILSCFK